MENIINFLFSDQSQVNLDDPYPRSTNEDDQIRSDDSMDDTENITINFDTDEIDEFPGAITANSLGAVQRVNTSQDLRKLLQGNLRKRLGMCDQESENHHRESSFTIGT